MVAAALIFSFGLFLVKLAKSDSITMMVVRGIGNILLVMIHSWVEEEDIFKDWETTDMAVIRGLLVAFSTVVSNIAIKLIKLSLYGILVRLEMIALLLMSIFVQGNPFSWRVFISAILSFFGVSLVIAPNMYGLSVGTSGSLQLSWTHSEIIGVLLCGVWICADSSMVTFLAKTASKVSMTQSLFTLNALIAMLGGGIKTVTGVPLTLYWDDIGYYVATTFVYYFAVLLMNESFRTEKNVGMQAILMSVYVVGCFALDMIFLGTRLSVWNWVGCTIILAATIWAVLIRTEVSKKSEPTPAAEDKKVELLEDK